MGADQVVDRMGFAQGQIILEVGLKSDCDQDLRNSLLQKTGTEFIEGSAHEVVDSVLLWWRDDDGDLVDELVDALTFLTEEGPIWVLTPKVGRDGHVEASEIQDSAPTSGLSLTTTFQASKDWIATRLVARKSGRK